MTSGLCNKHAIEVTFFVSPHSAELEFDIRRSTRHPAKGLVCEETQTYIAEKNYSPLILEKMELENSVFAEEGGNLDQEGKILCAVVEP